MVTTYILTGLLFATLGAFLLALNALIFLFGDAKEEAERQLKAEYNALAPDKGVWDRLVAERTSLLRCKKAIYTLAVGLIFVGFTLQVVGTALP